MRDQDRALELYTKKLGCRVITDSPFDGTQRWIELGRSDRARAGEAGVEFVQEPRKADWGTRAIFKDPDGNRFVLSTP